MRRWMALLPALLAAALFVIPIATWGQATPATPEPLPSLLETLTAADATPLAIASDRFSGATAGQPDDDIIFTYRFVAMRFDTPEAATRAMPVPIAYFSASRPLATAEIAEPRLSLIADEQRATSLFWPSDQSAGVQEIYASFRIGPIVLYAEIAGSGQNVTRNLISQATPTIERIRRHNPATAEELLAILPALDSMPAGFTEEGPIDPAFRPIPTPTPAVQTQPGAFSTSGYGNLRAGITLLGGAYLATFTCSDPAGTARAVIIPGYIGEISTTPVRIVVDRPKTTPSSINVTCPGAWTLTFTPE